MMNSSDYLTHIKNDEDCVYLQSTLFPVNIRLFKSSPTYKKIILDQCNYIRTLALTTMEGYKKPHGMSAANAGLSFNIIGVVKNRNKLNEYCDIMINPKIIDRSIETVDAISNCGSITLNKSITIKRFEKIVVEWFDETGKQLLNVFTRESNGFTIQHEIDHNNGILITDHINE